MAEAFSNANDVLVNIYKVFKGKTAETKSDINGQITHAHYIKPSCTSSDRIIMCLYIKQ